MGKDLYLTDKQWLSILYKIRDTISKPGFKPGGCDSTEPGNKYTETNCGLCNDNFTTLKTSLFPEEFKDGRTTMKYTEDHQICPFDTRPRDSDHFSGCQYTCGIFNKKLLKGNKLLDLVNETIIYAEEIINV